LGKDLGEKRVKERYILEIIEIVSKWRKLAKKSKLNYSEAAKFLDVPKKSLDDYYYIIRMG